MVKPFLLVIVDRDKEQFTVEGPMTDDTRWNDAIVAAQDSGRLVNCSTPGTSCIGEAINQAEQQLRYGHVPPGSIVRPKL